LRKALGALVHNRACSMLRHQTGAAPSSSTCIHSIGSSSSNPLMLQQLGSGACRSRLRAHQPGLKKSRCEAVPEPSSA